jgi:hypothetical protein
MMWKKPPTKATPMGIAELRKRTGIADLLFLDRVQDYIYRQTDTLVSRQRIGRWVNRGELTVMRLPGRRKYRVTRKEYVDDLIRRYS